MMESAGKEGARAGAFTGCAFGAFGLAVGENGPVQGQGWIAGSDTALVGLSREHLERAFPLPPDRGQGEGGEHAVIHIVGRRESWFAACALMPPFSAVRHVPMWLCVRARPDAWISEVQLPSIAIGFLNARRSMLRDLSGAEQWLQDRRCTPEAPLGVDDLRTLCAIRGEQGYRYCAMWERPFWRALQLQAEADSRRVGLEHVYITVSVGTEEPSRMASQGHPRHFTAHETRPAQVPPPVLFGAIADDVLVRRMGVVELVASVPASEVDPCSTRLELRVQPPLDMRPISSLTLADAPAWASAVWEHGSPSDSAAAIRARMQTSTSHELETVLLAQLLAHSPAAARQDPVALLAVVRDLLPRACPPDRPKQS